MIARHVWPSAFPAGTPGLEASFRRGSHLRSSRQYVVTVDGGHGSFGTRLGDCVRAYALPERRQQTSGGLTRGAAASARGGGTDGQPSMPRSPGRQRSRAARAPC
ncbi:hypothetical protein DCG74_19205 [Bradyrhizobium sp. WBAH42]|nr:hypothetical protein [Bradyrhizobium sp. WBAH30]MDD1541069.1 hypothetical protein [Bradyrhizobium sp. WBAH41]MDD1557307.1 hypothetical protein [Bradyrhizobium sp. WBAH23]MDD1563704.1 hypothetical protein [Bradyrhizobium sp. WBAH33]MDD1590127.1 hypothetical protein [Bradyrhizobium sp. WBAH42]NRB86760.1 hypothetical protein [Bradyrhizobium sp. WBAH10]QCJ90479.1 hypothetical protein DAA57_19655 [Bradyrhizobium yuanmingense]